MPRLTTPASIAAAPASARPLLEAVKQADRQRAEPVPPGRQQPGRAGGLPGHVRRAGQGQPAGADARAHRAGRGARSTTATTACRRTATWARTWRSSDEAEIAANRHGTSLDPKADAAVRFAAKVTQRARASVRCRRVLRCGWPATRGTDRRDRAARGAEHLDQLHQLRWRGPRSTSRCTRASRLSRSPFPAHDALAPARCRADATFDDLENACR
jgi:hypothetical protein